MAANGAERHQQQTAPGNGGEPPVFTEHEFEHISAYLSTLKRIHIRLMIEGYQIVDGEIVRPGQGEEAES